MDHVDIYCINLKDRKDRKDSILENFKDENITFFDALNGKQLGIYSLWLRTQGMVGCFLSHHALYRHIAATTDKDWTIIIEDDLIPTSNWKEFFLKWISEIPDDADVAMIGWYKRNKNTKIQNIGNWTIVDKWYGMHFYAVRTSSLEKIIGLTSSISNQIDLQLCELSLQNKLKIYNAVIPLGKQSGSKTNVQSDNL